jgi:beta-lactamase regulating signal transducer with metallopeptidase domain
MIPLVPLHVVLGWLFSVTVKGSIVILFIALLQWTVGRHLHARWRHALWLLVLLRLALPVAPVSSVSIFNLLPVTTMMQPHLPYRMSEPLQIRTAQINVSTQQSSFVRVSSAPPFIRWIFAIWLLGVSLLSLRLVITSLRMRRTVNRGRRASGPDLYLESVLAEAIERVGIPRWVKRINIFESGIVRTPALHGLRKTTLLLPRGMSGTFTREELRHVILHELWHVRRFDVGISWLLSVTEAVHWFNPFVWFATSRIKEERELACDELALSCLELEERFSYGTTILKLLERFRVTAVPVPALVGIVNQKQKMKRRLTMIASYKNRTRFSLMFASVLAVASVVAFTDARGGETKMLRRMNPAMLAIHEKMSQRVSLDLTDATFSELLATVSARAGTVITQSTEVATSRAQQAHFTIKADNVPVHAILMEALSPFELMPAPGDNGLTIVSGSGHMMMLHDGMMKHHAESMESEGTPAPGQGVERKRVIVIEDGDMSAADHARMEKEIAEQDAAGETPGQHEIRIRHNVKGPAALDANGKSHRELTINIDEDGVKSIGKLTVDIAAPPAAQ